MVLLIYWIDVHHHLVSSYFQTCLENMLLAESEESYLLHQIPGQFYMHNEKLAYEKNRKKSETEPSVAFLLFYSQWAKKISRPDMVDEST